MSRFHWSRLMRGPLPAHRGCGVEVGVEFPHVDEAVAHGADERVVIAGEGQACVGSGADVDDRFECGCGRVDGVDAQGAVAADGG
jgi:hypothetical protein